MAKGTIARLMDRGFGFIKGEGEGDLFFHSSNLEGVEFNPAFPISNWVNRHLSMVK